MYRDKSSMLCCTPLSMNRQIINPVSMTSTTEFVHLTMTQCFQYKEITQNWSVVHSLCEEIFWFQKIIVLSQSSIYWYNFLKKYICNMYYSLSLKQHESSSIFIDSVCALEFEKKNPPQLFFSSLVRTGRTASTLVSGRLVSPHYSLSHL